MKIIVFGATGFVGRQLVPLLKSRGHHLLIVGRDKDKIKRAFPGIEAATYANFADQASLYDLAINLATVNSNSNKSLQEFYAVNRDLLQDLARRCHDIQIPKFINFSSVHALDEQNNGNYAVSKREGANLLKAMCLDNYFSVYLPSVFGKKWSGKLEFLNKLPKPLARAVFALLAALKPTVQIDTVVDEILDENGEAFAPKIISSRQENNGFYHFVRRAVDLMFAALVIIVFWWLLIALWIAVKIDSRGPGIFAQRRVGQFGNEFTCYKFRTMTVGTAQRGTHEVSKSAVTRVGRVFRKFKLDELPQVINILKGEMSLIGPRPCLPVQEELIHERRIRGVLEIKPGISGYAQIRNIDMSEPVFLAKTDAAYVGLRGLVLDCKIAIATAFGSGMSDKTR
ncbi:sugar transferase [Maritalea mobilis]|uniref:sugar transferase n=1 Tax=Maritalea mobilis TaxID=483324 RepID=UPI00105EBE50|nr:sugar transferase [Maritalea mobilis]